jgi:hypothetical protein
MHCVRCGSPLRRLARESFLQRKVYSMFGYYPWECPLCREPILFKQRGVRIRRSLHEDEFPQDPGFEKSSNKSSSGMSSAKSG